MRYLKLFEDKSQLYSEINSILFFRYLGSRMLEFNQLEVNKIKDLYSCSISDTSRSIIITYDNKHIQFYISIYKIDDEWYMVSFVLWNNGLTQKYYKCDQWNGLVECLENEFDLEQRTFNLK